MNKFNRSENSYTEGALFEGIINYSFKDTELLLKALSHSSYVNEEKKASILSNQRLEFLGDAVLQIAISDYLYNNFPDMDEGGLSTLRASVVCEQTLAEVAERLHINQHILVSKSLSDRDRRCRAMLCDTFEAILGAIYLDGGFESAKDWAIAQLKDMIDSNNSAAFKDYKTILQEKIQKDSKGGLPQKLAYHIENEQGPSHNKIFYAHVCLNEQTIGNGKGKSKKEAEQDAAKCALDKFEQQ